MKINTYTTVLSLILVAIISFALAWFMPKGTQLLLGVGSYISLGLTAAGTISISFDYDRTTVLTRTTSGIFFVILLVSQIVFVALNQFSLPIYVLVTGCTTIIYSMIFYGISKSNH
jgi:hypothetical protein